MAETRFLYNNLWRKGAILTPSSEDLKHPATDTQIDTRKMFFRASSKVSPCNVPNDLGSAKEIDTVVILGHNFESSGVTIKFEGADDENFTVGLESRTLTYNATDIFAFVTSLTKRYVRVRLEKATDFVEYPQFATVICGKYFEPNIDYVKGYTLGMQDYSEVSFSDDMVLYSQERAVLKKWYLPYWSLDDTSKEEALSMMKECGGHKALVVVFDKDNPNSDSHLVRIIDASPPEFQFFDIWNWELGITEVV